MMIFFFEWSYHTYFVKHPLWSVLYHENTLLIKTKQNKPLYIYFHQLTLTALIIPENNLYF